MHMHEGTAVVAGSMQEPGAASRGAFEDNCDLEVGKSKSGLQEKWQKSKKCKPLLCGKGPCRTG